MTNQAVPENNQEPLSDKPSNEQKDQAASPDIEQLRKEASEYKDKYLRSIAEAENLRKRLHKERHDMTQLAIQGVINDFLDPIDHLEKALGHTNGMSEEVKNWAIGFKMILNQFRDALSANDVHPFKSVGMAFDPHNHEAIEMVETMESPAGTVVEESTRGYKMGSKTIRPARVKVSKQPAPVKQPEQDPTKTGNHEEKSDMP